MQLSICPPPPNAVEYNIANIRATAIKEDTASDKNITRKNIFQLSRFILEKSLNSLHHPLSCDLNSLHHPLSWVLNHSLAEEEEIVVYLRLPPSES